MEDGTARPGYRVAERVAGHGVATATVRELCRMATAMYGLRTLRAATFHDNAASRKVLAKAGFVSVGPATPADVGEDSTATAGEMPTGMEAAINEYLNRARAAQASGKERGGHRHHEQGPGAHGQGREARLTTGEVMRYGFGVPHHITSSAFGTFSNSAGARPWPSRQTLPEPFRSSFQEELADALPARLGVTGQARDDIALVVIRL